MDAWPKEKHMDARSEGKGLPPIMLLENTRQDSSLSKA